MKVVDLTTLTDEELKKLVIELKNNNTDKIWNCYKGVASDTVDVLVSLWGVDNARYITAKKIYNFMLEIDNEED